MIRIELTLREAGDVHNAFERYKDFCRNCISTFKGSGHDEHYKDVLARVCALDGKFINAINNNEEEG